MSVYAHDRVRGACAQLGELSPLGGRGGAVTAGHRKGSSMAKARRPQRRRAYPVRPCAWCAHPVQGDAVTVTFPDKAQATFHVTCLDRYRAVMWPGTAR
jgi:hypothetical protein